MLRFAYSLFLFTVVAGAGCSSSSSSTSTTTAEIDSACTDIAQARCDRFTACSSTAIQTRFGDAASCVAQLKANCVAGLEAPNNANNTTHTEACATAIAGWACPDYLDNDSPPAACAQVMGTAATGAACVVAGQCQTGFCAIAPGSACGVCAALPKAGDACTALTTCGVGLTCTSDTKMCVAFAAANAACGAGAPCGAGLVCVGANAATSTQGTCQAAATTTGATCDPALKTGTGCDRNAGLVCNSTSKTCQPATISPDGGACGSVDHQSALCENGTCVGASGATPGTCIANAGEGEACDTAQGPNCEAGTRCIVAAGTTAGTCENTDAAACK